MPTKFEKKIGELSEDQLERLYELAQKRETELRAHNLDQLARDRLKGIEQAWEIKTPVWTRPLRFHTGGVIKFWGPMECGKTRTMLASLFEIVRTQGFPPDRVFANCWIDLPGSHWLRNDELKRVLRRAFNTEVGEGRWNKCIFLVMEADDLYSHIVQEDKNCFRDLLKASQSYKRNMYLLYEVHEGKGVPKYLRDKTEISVRPRPLSQIPDALELIVCDGHYDKTYTQPLHNISAVNNRYRRFDELY